MNDRDFLNKIRKMQETGKTIGLTEMESIDNNKSDKINLLEEAFKFPILTEDTEEGQDISSDEQREEENTFKDTVTQLVEFEKIKVYKKNVEWSGRLVRERINWVYSLEDQVGCYISTDNDDILQLTDNVLEVVKKIRAYYDIWSEEWSSRLTGGTPTEEGGTEEGGFGGPETEGF